MPTDPYWRIKELFVQAVEMAPEDRAAFLEAACGGDQDLRGRVETLLASHDRAAGLVLPPKHAEPPVTNFPAEAPGTVIGPYVTRELIGEGGMGVVYKAEQRSPIHRFVALKLIKLGMDTKQVLARFDSERQALALMNHPNVAAVYDAGATESGRPYFVMEYVPGTPITTFCDRHKYTTRQRLELFVQACSAIQHAHQKAIIHRDVKPGNILVTMSGDRPVVKVIDFGVSKATAQRLTEHSVFTETGQLVGTPEYMSPEQAELNPQDVDTRTDIYSLGVVLYQLLAGALPFDSKSLRQAAYAQIQAIVREVDPPRPSTRFSSMKGEAAAEVAARRGTLPAALARELRGELEWIPMKAMRKDRARRYNNATELAQDIQNYFEGKPLLAAPESRAYRLRKFVARNKGPLTASALVFVVLVAGIIGTTFGMIGQSRQRAIAEQQAAEARKQEEESEKLAALATAVSQFQGSMLAGVNTGGVSGDKLTVLQVVDAAVKELDAGKLKGQPLAEANVREMIAETYRALGRHGEAEPVLRKVIELRQGALTTPHWGIAQGMHSLAVTLQELGRLAEAETLMREALEMRRAVLPAGDANISNSLSALGMLLQVGGKYAEAETFCREAVAIDRRNFPAGHLNLTPGLIHLGWVLQVQNKFGEAEAICREALDIRRRHLVPTDTDIAEALNNLAVVLARTARFDEAEPLLREMLQIDRKSLPAGHPRIGQSVNNLASVLHEQGKFDEAETLVREGLELRRQSLPPGHPYVAQSLKNLAALLHKKGALAEAEPLAREALAMRRKALPAGHPDIANSLQNVGVILADLKQYAEAESCLREASTFYESAFGQDDLRLGNVLLELGLVLTELDRLADAERSLLRAERIIAAARGAPPGRHDKSVQALITLYGRWHQADPDKGHAAQAEPWKLRLSANSTTSPATTQP